MTMQSRRYFLAVLALVILGFTGAALADELYKIPVEHNHRKGECQGVLIVRDDKVVFESRLGEDSRVWEYGNLERIDVKNEFEFHVWFTDREHGKGQKYVMKFKNGRPENQEALNYIMSRIGQVRAEQHAPAGGGYLELPYRLGVELDLNGPNCMGTLVLREDKIIFETGAPKCSDRAFVRDWDTLKSYVRVQDREFLLVFYKYGPSAPAKITELRFWSKGGPVPPEVEQFLLSRAQGR